MTATRVLCAIFAALLLPTIVTPAHAAELGGESPEALITKLRAASETEDFGKLAALLAPDARLEMAQGLWAGATMMVAMSSSMGDLAAEMGQTLGEETEEGKAESAKTKA